MYFFPPRYVRGSVYDTYLKKMQVKEGKKTLYFYSFYLSLTPVNILIYHFFLHLRLLQTMGQTCRFTFPSQELDLVFSM